MTTAAGSVYARYRQMSASDIAEATTMGAANVSHSGSAITVRSTTSPRDATTTLTLPNIVTAKYRKNATNNGSFQYVAIRVRLPTDNIATARPEGNVLAHRTVVASSTTPGAKVSASERQGTRRRTKRWIPNNITQTPNSRLSIAAATAIAVAMPGPRSRRCT